MNTNMKFKTIANNIALGLPASEKYFLLDNKQLIKVLNYNTNVNLLNENLLPLIHNR